MNLYSNTRYLIHPVQQYALFCKNKIFLSEESYKNITLQTVKSLKYVQNIAL